MKKVMFFLLTIVFLIVLQLTPFAASVTPQEVIGNDSNFEEYQPPSGCLRITLPNSDSIGIHTYRFDDNGKLSLGGENTLTIEIGLSPDINDFKIISWTWSGNYHLHGIIILSDELFSLYQYDGSVTKDTDLFPPVRTYEGGKEIDHISVVIEPLAVTFRPYSEFETIVLGFMTVIFLFLFVTLIVVLRIKHTLDLIN